MYDLNKKKTKKIESILLSVFLIVICIGDIIIKFDDYNAVLTNNYYRINKIEDLNKSNRFKSANLKEAKMENYSIINNEKKVNIYTYELDGENILVLLNENTINTSKTPVQVINDNSITLDIKNKLKRNNYYKKVLSNVNFNLDRKIQLYTSYIMFTLIILSFISIIFNFIGLIRLKSVN